MFVSDVEINTEIDFRVYTGYTVCKPAYTVLCYKMCENMGLFENSTTQECCLRIPLEGVLLENTT
jgi:hypothetical protein